MPSLIGPRAYTGAMARRRIDQRDGMAALGEWAAEGKAAPRRQVVTAVRFTLEEVGALHPGRAVEVRVPPAVIETDAHTWLALATGRLRWDEAVRSGRVQASGERADLSAYLPVIDFPSARAVSR